MERAVFLGFNALGDTLCTTPTIRAFRREHPDAHITYVAQSASFTRVLDHNPDIDYVHYSEFMYLNGLTKFTEDWLYSLPLDFSEPATLYKFDMNQMCTTEEVFHEHIATGFSKLLKIPIQSIRPRIHLTEEEREFAASLVQAPYAVLSMHSNSNPKRESGEGGKKDWPRERWEETCKRLREAGIEDIVAVGSEFDTRERNVHWRNLYGLPIRIVGALMERAACVLTLENGIGHLAHAVDANMVMLYSDIVPLGWANPAEATNCEVLYGSPLDASVDQVGEALDNVLSRSGALSGTGVLEPALVAGAAR